MRIPQKYIVLIIFALIFGYNTRVNAEQIPSGYMIVSNYLESFTDASATYSTTTLPRGWFRLEDNNGNLSYSMTRENGGHQGIAIGQTKGQSNVRSGSNTIDLYDYIVTPQVKGTIKIWVARYSIGTTPQVEVYKLTKTGTGFSCNPQTDLLFSVSENSWPQFINSNPAGWVEQTFSVANFEHLGFRISYAYIDDFEASFAVIPGNVNSQTNSGAVNNGSLISSTVEVSKSGVTPYFTANTLFMITDPSSDRFSQVTDSVFAINTGGNYEFWTVTGEKLYDAIWRMPKDYSSSKPQFDGGVVAMRMSEPNKAGQKPICLLYIDGKVKELNPAWKYVSKFEDGLALVEDDRQNLFYINAAGQKMYPELMLGNTVNNEARPLRNGLRAFYGMTSKTGDSGWGFIDTDGHIVIAPEYHSVTDFSDGYAWAVKMNPSTGINSKELIDTHGNVVYRLEKYTTKTYDVVDGVFIEEEAQKAVYRDTSGNQLASFTDATTFYDDYAFVQTKAMGGNVSLINHDFRILKEFSDKILAPSDLRYVNFEPFGLSTIGGNEVIAPNGTVIIREYGTGFENKIGNFGEFSESGYATAEGYIDSDRCFFYIKPTGEIAWMFSNRSGAGGPWKGGNPPFPEPEPWEPPYIKDPIPPLPPLPPIGPKIVETVKFTVTTVAAPAEGGSVSITPHREFEYGENATLNAVAKKDWAISYIECSPLGSTKVENGKPFNVTSEMTIIVHFVKKDDDTGPDNKGCFQGLNVPIEGSDVYGLKEWEIPIYAEISDLGATESPYGNKNYGFLVAMFDPTTKYTSKKKDLSCNFFAAPLKITGFQKDKEGRRWMVVDGGAVTSANISAGGDMITQMVFGAMLGLSDMSKVTTAPRHYRIEMLDIDSESGEFTFGELQTYSPQSGGWVAGGSKEVTNKKKGAFAKHYDSGYSADFFQGVRMKTSPKRNDVQWYPPESWSEGKSGYKALMERMREAYGSAKSDYEKLFGD